MGCPSELSALRLESGLQPPGDAVQSRRLVATMQATEERSQEGSAPRLERTVDETQGQIMETQSKLAAGQILSGQDRNNFSIHPWITG